MSQIKDDKSAKVGLSGLFGTRTNPETTTAPKTTPETTREEILQTLSPETREELQKEVQRRQYLKAGRPPKSEGRKKADYTRMTFIVSPEKQTRLREIALRETFGDSVFKTKIRENVDISESPLQCKDIYSYSPDSIGAKDYESLALEVVAKFE